MHTQADSNDPGFQEWFDAPAGPPARDPRYEVRRATPADFPQIYDLVDRVWQRTWPRAAYDWLYLDNPLGIARSTLVFERDSGALVSCGSGWPWPVAYGAERLSARFGGDSVTLPRLQRQGIGALRRDFGRAHPQHRTTVQLGAPNPKSRAATAKYGDVPPIGPLTNVTLVVDSARYLESKSAPALAARLIGRSADAAMDLWRDTRLGKPTHLRVEALQRFAADVDPLTEACMRTDNYWCPHDARFLNWRYFSNPRHTYEARAILADEQIQGFGVIRLAGSSALLMEFVAPQSPTLVAGTVLRSLITVARDAGCDRMDFHATSRWRHWRLFRAAGFIKRSSAVYRDARCLARPDVAHEANWQILAGDSDVY